MLEPKKILVIRFSSIGDIVLTTPVIRCLKKQLQNTEIHFICKSAFAETLIHNPYIEKLYTFKNDIDEVLHDLKTENYELIIDLHYNLRSLRLKRMLGVKALHFNKLNIITTKNSSIDRYIEYISYLREIKDVIKFI